MPVAFTANPRWVCSFNAKLTLAVSGLETALHWKQIQGKSSLAAAIFTLCFFLTIWPSKYWKTKSLLDGSRSGFTPSEGLCSEGNVMRQRLSYHLSSRSCSFQPEGRIYSLLGSILACLFVSGSRLWDEQSIHADSDGIQPSTPGQRNPDVLPVDSRSHHFSYGCQRSAVLPNEPQADQAGGRCAHRDCPHDLFSCRSWSLHAAGSKVGEQAVRLELGSAWGISAAEV